MKNRTAHLPILVSLCAAVLTAPTVSGHERISEAEIARRLVADILQVRPDEAIQVTTDLSNPALVEEVAVAIRKAGAFPLIVYDSPKLSRRILAETPEPFLARTPEYQIKMLRVIDAAINLPAPTSPALMAQIPEHRVALVRKAFEPVAERLQSSPQRIVSLGNNGVPSKSLAEFHGAPLKALEDNFWRGIAADPKALTARGERVSAILGAARTLRLTAANGTSLEMRLVERPVILNSGTIPPLESTSKGREVRQVWLPAGEAYTSPLETSVNGVLRLDSAEYRGTKIQDLRLLFRDGRVIEISARKGAEILQEALDLSGGDKDRIAVVDVGLNPGSRPIPGSTYHSYEMEGMVTIGIGGVVWAPTENRSDFAAVFFLPGATLEADGRLIVKDGKLEI
jgi:leucyl aminopeptidase (aminopeptidase T)